MNARPPRWKYQPDEVPKRKHAWDRAEAGFVDVGGTRVGKCPANISNSEAEDLLNRGIEVRSSRETCAWPGRIYVVREGVVYRATPTVPGISYHAFPELPKRLRELPTAIQHAIIKRAKELGCEVEVRRWMNG